MESIKSNFGVADPMVQGLQRHKESLQQFHPLEASEKDFERNRLAADLEQLRKMQGVHAPLRVMMERRAVANVGHLPCITQRSNLHADVLSGRDELIAPADVFGRPENFEGMSMPHNVIEKHLMRGGF
jgi:proteasome maturation protein